MKKILVILPLLLMLTGCWNYRELNEYAIATGMAIDYENDKYEVSLIFASGKKDEEDDTQVTVSSEKGDTIYQAIKNIGLSTPKEIYISHLSVIVLSEEVAKNGVTPVLDYLLREPQSHQNFYIVVAKDTKAKDTLSVLAPLSDYTSQNITSTLKVTQEMQARITDASFTQFVSKILKKGINPISNSIIIVGNSEEGTKKEEQKNSVTSAYTKLDTLGIFKDDKLLDWATKEESVGINMLLGDVKTIYIDLPCENKNVIITSNSYNIKNKIDKNKIKVNIDAEGMINEVGCKLDLNDNNIIKSLEKRTEDKMNEYVQKALTKTKDLKTDIFGYGNMIYKKYPKYFNKINNWDEQFSNLEIDVNINFKIKNKGSLKQTIGEETK